MVRASDEYMTKEYRSRKSNSVFTVKGTARRAFLGITGEASTNPKAQAQAARVRSGAYDFATVDWIARQMKETY